MTEDHGHCPACNADLNGGSIWETGYQFALEGKLYDQHGTPCIDQGEAARLADKYAACYGATRTEGKWGREIGIYDMEKDRTVAWRCPDCEHEWSI